MSGNKSTKTSQNTVQSTELKEFRLFFNGMGSAPFFFFFLAKPHPVAVNVVLRAEL